MARNLEPIKKDGYSIEASERNNRLSVVLNGTFDMTAAQDLQRFLDDVRQEAEATYPVQLDIDVSSVYYLGSSCIKAFVSLTAAMKAQLRRPKIRVITSSRLDWQDRTFAVLARLAPELVTVERSS
jgi:anti-anti-sigma regulatory factor